MSSRPTSGLDRGWHVVGGPFRLRGERIRARFGETSPEPWRRRAGPPYSTQVASRRQLNYGMVAPSFSPSLSAHSSVAVRSPDHCAFFE